MAYAGARRVIAVWALVASTAVAQTHDPAAAELLFREARKAFAAGRTEEACAKFAESQRLDPGAGTLINLAACEEKLGKLASAWEKWQRALEQLRADDTRRAGVEKRAAALEARVPRLEIRLAAGAPPGTAVVRDEIALGTASFGVALPVDPGAHRVIVQAPGREAKTFDVQVAEAETKTLEVEPGAPLPQAPQPRPATSRVRAAAIEPETDDAFRRTATFVALGVGATGVLVGSVTGILALTKKSEMNDECTRRGGALECSNDGMDAAAAGDTYAAVSTVAFSVGLAGLGFGGYLLLTGNGSRTGAALGVTGEF